MNSAYTSVYLVDPDAAVHDAISELLGAAGAQVVCFRSAEEFLDSDAACSSLQGCVLAEADLPGMGSLAFLRQLHIHGIEVPVIVLTSTANRDIADQALKAGAVEVISKPLVGNRLLKFLDGLTSENSVGLVEKNGKRQA